MTFPAFEPLRRRKVPSTDALFEEGNVAWGLLVQSDQQQQQQQAAATMTEESQPGPLHLARPMACGYSGCKETFADALEYDAHVQAAHRLVCRVCRRIYPTPRLLELHVLENHDTLFAVMAEREKMYACFVEGCQRKFMDEHKRRMHLIDLHKYPRTFQFSLSAQPRRARVARPPASDDRGSAATATSPAAARPNPYLAHQDSAAMCAMDAAAAGPRVPTQISFGHGRPRGFAAAPPPFRPRSVRPPRPREAMDT